MTRSILLPRVALALAMTTLLLGGTGCSWFRKGDKLYTADAASRPLEVPPDLDIPRGNEIAGSAVMASTTQQGRAAPASGVAAPTGGFIIAGTRDAAFEQVGTALQAVDGVTIATRAQLLGVFDVNYGGENFLVRVASTDAGAYVSTVDPRGQPVSSEAAIRLMESLKSAVGGR